MTGFRVCMLFLLFQMRALGAGDIKLFSVVGGFVTERQLLWVMAIAFLVAAAIGAGKLAYVRWTTGSWGRNRTYMHFSPAIFIAYGIVVWGCVVE